MSQVMFSQLKGVVNEVLFGIQKEVIKYPKQYVTGRNAAYCPRQSYFSSILETTDTLTALPLLTAEFGKIWENAFLFEAKHQNVLVGHSVTINTELLPIDNLNYFGIIDGVLKVNGEYVVVDIKSKDSIYQKTTGDKLEKIKAKPNDLSQISFYAAITGLPCALIYLSRKVSEKYGEVSHEVIPVEVDQLQILHMAFFSSYCITHNLLPKIPTNFKKSVHCKNCPFYSYCWSNTPIPFDTIDAHPEAYEVTKGYAQQYLDNIDEYRQRFIDLLLADQLRGKYYQDLTSY